MSDWQPGDLALCVKTSDKRTSPADRARGIRGCRKGMIYTVEQVVNWFGDTGLVIVGHYSGHPSRSWLHEGFRKIRPHTPDAEDIETIRLMNGKPVPVEA